MEASDITGELHLCMEVIAIAGLEQQAYGKKSSDPCAWIPESDAVLQ